MKQKNSPRGSVVLKLILVGFLALVLLAPTAMIQNLVHEREERRDEAVDEVGSKWGGEQIIAGPILTVPYKKIVKVLSQETAEQTAYAHFLPEELKISGNASSQVLNRGIYDIPVYDTNLKFQGQFAPLDFGSFDVYNNKILWDDTVVSIVITDPRGINKEINFTWDGQVFKAEPGLGTNSLASLKLSSSNKNEALSPVYKEQSGTTDSSNHGVSAKIPFSSFASRQDYHTFDFQLDVNGSKELFFLPLGSKTEIKISSDWQNPSFNGAFLPDSREINENGFKADWTILKINRDFAGAWSGDASASISNSDFGVKLLLPVDEYQKNTRSIKYAILIISLTFLIFFFIEVMNRIRIHPIQYLLVGLALVLFFSLLLSLSEHLGFNLSYLVAGAGTILMITLYSWAIFKRFWLAIIEGVFLSFIYIFIFVILRLQDYSLLVGSVGLFVVLAIIMFISRKVDWYMAGAMDLTEKDNE